MEWIQVYDPLGMQWLSTLAAALPMVVLFFTLGIVQRPAHQAALLGLLSALAVAVGLYGMPAGAAAAAAAYGAAFGLFPIGWIVLNAVFLYNLTVFSGTFEIVKSSVAHLSSDPRVQVLLVAFAFGAFIEGAAGFGAPVAITAALMIGLGFTPLHAAGLSLIANTAPVAFGAIGTPILTLSAITGFSPEILSAMAGRQLPLISVIIPVWLIVTMSGWKGLRGVWPVALVCGGSFAGTQFLWSNYVGPELVDIIGGMASLICTGAFCAVWRPSDSAADPARLSSASPAAALSRSRTLHGWMPWILLSLFVMVWGLGPVKAALSRGPVLSPTLSVPRLDRMVYRDYPVVPAAADPGRIADAGYKLQRAERAQFSFNWLSATGTGIFLAAIAAAFYLRIRPRDFLAVWRDTMKSMKWALITIALMLALGFVTRYGGTDATMGMAFTHTGLLYPFFAALLGWLGVALTGSDTSSNVLFGSLQKITAEQLGLNPILITASNSTGGVMGKMLAAQSIVVATAATGRSGEEGRILRYVFWHSIVLASLMGLIVMLQAYVFPWMIPQP
ncbi:MAG: L-lactate permease [Acidobacteriota bacterium]